MRGSTNSIVIVLIIVLAAAMFPSLARSQSGRGRPKVPAPSPGAPPPPPPITIPAAASVVKQEQFGNVSRFLLRNGVTVIISEQHAAPIVASVACFKAGTRDEPEAARLVARSLTAGGRPQIADLRATGSVLRADVSSEASTYSLVAPSTKIKEALAAQAGLLQNLATDDDQVRRDAALLIEEEKWNSGLPNDVSEHARTTGGLKDYQPAAYSMARVMNIASPGNSITRPLNPEKLGLITHDQVEAFYRAHYRPDRLIIAITGDVVPFTILVQIQHLYAGLGVRAQPATEPAKNPERLAGKGASPASSAGARRPDQAKKAAEIQPPASKPASPPMETEQSKLRYAGERGDLNQSIVSIGYSVPGPESKEWAVIEVLSALAGAGRASLLHSSLVDGQMAASRVDSIYVPVSNAAMLIFQICPAGDASGASIDKAESGFFREIDRLRREVPSEAEMIRAKAMLEKRFIDRTESYDDRARELARAEAVFGGLRAALEYKTTIGAVKPEDVQRVAAKYLALTNTSVHEYEGLNAPPRTFDADSFATTVIAWAPELARPVNAPSAAAPDANAALATQRGVERSAQQQAEMESIQALSVKDFSTLNGPRAFVREDRSVPKVTVALLFQGGRLVEAEANTGITELMLRSLLYGTVRRTSSQLAQEWEQLGAEIEIVVEPDFFGFTLSVLSRNADHTLKLLRDCIEDPAFRDDDVQRARVAQIGAIREARDPGLARARELLTRALYPGTPYSLPRHGLEEVAAKLTSEQLREWHSRLVKRQLPLAVIVGDTNGSALVSSQLAEAFRRRELDTALPVRVPGAPRPADQIELRRREQTYAAIGVPGPKAADGVGQDAVDLLAAAMNGAGGRLDREMVQKRFAMMSSLNSESLFAAGTIYALIVTTPGDEQRARSALLAEIEKLATIGLSPDEVAVGAALAAMTKLDALQSQRSRALEYARVVIAQRPASDVDSVAERLLKVTANDAKRAASTYLRPATSSAGIVRASRPTPPQSKQD
ncbi:MAG: insulinase family protein [Acidobacteriota bacterium]